MMRFSENMRWLREHQHLTQEELAKKMNVGRTTIASWEQGARSPKFKDALRIAQYFGVDIDVMMTGNVMLPEEKIEPTETETELIQSFRRLDEAQKTAVLAMVKAMVK